MILMKDPERGVDWNASFPNNTQFYISCLVVVDDKIPEILPHKIKSKSQ